MILNLGFVRFLRYNFVNRRTWWVTPMRDTFGVDIVRGQWQVQIAWHWWGFGREP